MRIEKSTVAIATLIAGIGVVSWFWTSQRLTTNRAADGLTVGVSGTTRMDSVGSGGFMFAIEADPHMDEQSDPEVFKATLRQIASAKPAFLIDLGDIFMVDKLSDKSEANIRNRYLLMKGYYDLLGPIPLHFAMGNHDGETGWDPLFTKEYRQTYFPDVTSDRNYYSFEQGDTLFVILDPYTYTNTKPTTDGWGWTLGREQYDWLKTTVGQSHAGHKFVFIHQLVGGGDQGRGGVEFAKLYEWGGSNSDGSYGFDARRPGWGKPIRDILKENGVQAVFKGHDHFFAKQELDGVIYQTLPQPSHPGDMVTTAAAYGYRSGVILGGSGYLRVTVYGSRTTVEFVKSDGTVAYKYSL